MYVDRLILSNIKGHDVDIVFRDKEIHKNQAGGWTVIVGTNGVGKTTLLRSIALAVLGPDNARSILPSFKGWITSGMKNGSISTQLFPHHGIDRTEKGGAPASGIWAELGFDVTSQDTVSMSTVDIFRNKKKGATNGPWSETTTGWFLVGYGPFRRMYGSSPDAQRLMVIPGDVPRVATLFKEDATLGEGEEWMKKLQFRILENRDNSKEILDGLIALLGTDFLRRGLKFERIDSDGIWLSDQLGRTIPFADMSEGYRAALAMLIDIYRHMVDKYEMTELLELNDRGRTVVTRPGVVLIDEVDAHLHPEWQREIGFWLTEHFPKVQFIVTTHSPLVCQAASDRGIFVLNGEKESPYVAQVTESEYWDIVGGRADEILTSPAFGLYATRSERAQEARSKYAKLKAKASTFALSKSEVQEYEQLELFVRSDS